MNSYIKFKPDVVFDTGAKRLQITMLLAQTMSYVMNSYTKYTTDVVCDIIAKK